MPLENSLWSNFFNDIRPSLSHATMKMFKNACHELDDAFFLPSKDAERTGWQPDYDVIERDHEFEVRLDLPGLMKQDVEVGVVQHGGKHYLSISGERKHHHIERNDRYIVQVRKHGNFRREIMLPKDAIEEDVKASMVDGVLIVCFPRKKADKKPVRKISID